ncbi:MAG TPA: heme o synthase [Candidatus Saccharimonadales bacterium]|jgi:protoheme IX farnesyltransferase|nr:heme o synthase [Candidatus Saccharimonadales bacterium]
MKATVSPSINSSSPAAVEKSLWAVMADLVKARLTFLVLLTTAVGFYMGWRGPMDFWLMAHTLAGTALLACGAAALNQLWEREHDARMRRTAERPLPSGRLQPETVLVFGGICSAAGLIYLVVAVNLLTSVLGAATLASYLFVYTPLKRVTWLNTAVGAVPGALPPLMGWTAARGDLTGEGWALFVILFFWQIPHFLAIAWLYREDYEKAGFVMLPSLDPEGYRTGRQSVSHTLLLVMASLLPFLFHLTGVVYLCGALLLGAAFLFCAAQFSRQLTRPRARLLFFISILYLPLLLGLMVLDKLKY